MLFVNDPKNVERALMTLASISFNEKSPDIPAFYDSKVIDRLLKLADQLETRVSYYSLDAIR